MIQDVKAQESAIEAISIQETSIQEAEKYIDAIPKFAKKTELKNTQMLLDALGVRHQDMNIIHVAGTNGKGSVCSYISNTLVLAGHKTGLFISPHLVKINERIQIDNTPVSDGLFVWAYEKVREAADRMEKSGGKHPAYFEFLFGMAMLIFKRENVKYAVLETGLGGLLDSTNVVTRPLMTVITSVSMDHMNVLGGTIEEIAAQKAGIIKAGVPLVFYGEDERVRKVVLAQADRLNAPFEAVCDGNVSQIEKKGKFIDFLLNNRYYDNVGFTVGSEAYYQVGNAALAATALAWLAKVNPECGLDLCIIRDGIRTAFWEGRMEEILPDVYVDGAHNEDGIRAFLDTVGRMREGRKILMFSAVADKKYESMLKNICDAGIFDCYVVCAVGYERRAVGGDIFADMLRQYTDRPVYVENSVREAFETAMLLKNENLRTHENTCSCGTARLHENTRLHENAQLHEDARLRENARPHENTRLFIAGSLYLVGEVKAIKDLFDKDLSD